MNVFFDDSIIIASLLSPTGGSSKLISYVHAGKIRGITSQTVIDEVLSHSLKIGLSEQKILTFIVESKLLVRKRIIGKEIESISKHMIDPDDAHVFAGAILTSSDILISLDKKHILHPDIQIQFSTLDICSPKELLSQLDL